MTGRFAIVAVLVLAAAMGLRLTWRRPGATPSSTAVRVDGDRAAGGGRAAGSGPVAGGDGVAGRTLAWRWVGLTAGVVAGYFTATAGFLGRGPLLAAPLFALFVLLGVLVGELWTSPSGGVRRAGLQARRVAHYLPSKLARSVGAAGVVLAGLVTVGTTTASADDLGRPGRQLALQCSTTVSRSAGPWPGSYYSIPLAVVVGLGMVLAVLALRAVVRRPRPGDLAERPDGDDELRRRPAAVVTAAGGILVCVPLLGITLTMASALRSLDCGPSWWLVAQGLLLGSLPVTLLLLTWCAGTVVAPARLRIGASR
jgi:hypothetical protein